MQPDSEETFSRPLPGRALRLAGALALASVCGASSAAFAQTQRRAGPSPTAAAEALVKLNRVEVHAAEAEVLDHAGRRLRFHADLIKGKVVVVSFIYTSCLYTCTTQGKYLAALQRALGERLGREVFLVTVSTDPVIDTPAKLKQWGEAFGVREGWTLVTGDRAPLESLRRSFPGVRAGRDAHEALIFVGNEARGLWVRADGLRPTAEILSLIEAVSAPASAPRGEGGAGLGAGGDRRPLHDAVHDGREGEGVLQAVAPELARWILDRKVNG